MLYEVVCLSTHDVNWGGGDLFDPQFPNRAQELRKQLVFSGVRPPMRDVLTRAGKLRPGSLYNDIVELAEACWQSDPLMRPPMWVVCMLLRAFCVKLRAEVHRPCLLVP